MARREGYERAKSDVGAQLLDGLLRIAPQVEGRVLFSDVGTPPSTMRFTRAADGASCGFQLNFLEYPFRETLARFTTPLDNVFMAGHGTMWPGSVPMAALSGRIVAQRLIEGYYARGFGRISRRIADFGARADVPGGAFEEPLAPRVHTTRSREAA
jgi:phytoene dehydrogenase-like protein